MTKSQRSKLRKAVVILVVVATVACGGSVASPTPPILHPAPSASTTPTSSEPTPTPSPTATPNATAHPLVYAAIGASETVGVGSAQPPQDAWPAVFLGMALPMGTEYHNFGISGERTAGAITDELPGALAVHPTVVTIWLNVNDLIAQVSVADYQTELQTLVHALRQGGAAKVLVANTPYLDRLPLYLACRGGAGAAGCSQVASLPGPDVVNSEVAAYNAAIASVTSTEGAILVDLHADGEVPDLHPQWVSADGFHPSTAGYVQVAGRFAAAYRG